MKKAKKILPLLLIFATVLSLCGCSGGNGKKLIGIWSLEYDFSNVMAGNLGEAYADFHAPFPVSICLEFKDDKTFAIYGDPDSFDASLSTWMDALVAFDAEMMYDAFAEEGLEREEADAAFEEDYGCSIAEYLRQTLEDRISVNADSISVSGNYDTSGEKLYLMTEGGKLDRNSYDLFAVNGNTLKLKLPDDADQSASEILPGLTYPLEFKKTK